MTPLTDEELKVWILWFREHKSELVSLFSDFFKIKLENLILYLEPFFLLGIIDGGGAVRFDIEDITRFREERQKRRKEEKRLKKEKKRR